MKVNKTIFSITRIALGFIFAWAFFDKLLGLGFATAPERAWIQGGSPTTGFLANAVHGPFAAFFQSLAGSALVDWLFMLGLLFIGLSFLFGKFIKWGSIAGITMMLLMYLALIPSENNPIVDDHLIYALVFALFLKAKKS